MERVEKSMGKGENAGYQHFLLFLNCFQKAALSMSLTPLSDDKFWTLPN